MASRRSAGPMATTLGNFFDSSGEGKRIDVAIGDQWQQRQIRGDASTIEAWTALARGSRCSL